MACRPDGSPRADGAACTTLYARYDRVVATGIRKELERQFIDAIDYMLDDQDVIQSDRWKGYRLNPYLVLVDVSQLHEKTKCHDPKRRKS